MKIDKSKWEYKKLGEICDKASSNIVLNKVKDVKGDYSLYGASGFVQTIDFYHQDKPYIGIVKDGSGVGRVNIYPAKSSLAGTMQYILPKDITNMSYLRYYLQHLHLERYATGAAIPHIYFKDYCKEDIYLPTITIQQQIVSELDKLNALISMKLQQLKEFDTLAQSIFYQMFGDGDKWNKKTLKEITLKMGSGATPRGGNQSYKSEGISLIRSMNVLNCEFKYKDLAHIDNEQASLLDNVAIEKNDVLINVTGASVARCCIVPNDVIPARVNQHVSILRTDKTVTPLYLCFFLSFPTTQKKLLALAKSKAATREALPKNALEKFIISLPPLPLQQSFAHKIEAIERQKTLVKSCIADLQELLAGKMDEYFG